MLQMLMAVLLMASCSKVEKENFIPISDITVSGIEASYTKLAVRDRYEITPTITSSYDEADFEYMWVIYDKDKVKDTISTDRNLSMGVSQPAGDYTLFYYVRNKTNGYYVHKTIELKVTTEFSMGHYILKETASGNTDFDLLTPSGKFLSDVILGTQGAPMAGRPRSMGILYRRSMIDPATLKQSPANSLGIITYNKEIQILRVSDMRKFFDQSTLFFDRRDASHIPYKFFTAGLYSSYISNEGHFYLGENQKTSGYLGFPFGVPGGGDHWAMPRVSYNLVYWDEANHRINYLTESMRANVLIDPQTANFDCLFMGAQNNNVLVLFKDRTTSKVYLNKYTASSQTAAIVRDKDKPSVELDGSFKLTTATHMATNERSAPLIYFINGNKSYYYDISSGLERDLVFDGLPADETITYLSHRYERQSIAKFDYLTIATQKGGNYKVYMYNMIGGRPFGLPQVTISGTGKVKETHFIGNATYSSNWDSNAARGADASYSR